MSKYFTQFDESNQTIGTNLVGWTLRYATDSSKPAYAQRGVVAVGRRYVGISDCIKSWDRLDSDANRDKFDVVACFAKDLANCEYGLIYARAASLNNNYRLVIFTSGNVLLQKVVAGVTTTIVTVSLTFSAGKNYFIRFRGNGTTLQVRVWDAALGKAGEPSAWNINTTDGAHSAAGWIGLGAIDTITPGTGTIMPFNFLAVGTNGDSAVCPRTNAERAAWLGGKIMPGESGQRRVIAELQATGYDSGGSPYTKTVNWYISKGGYISHPQDTPANQPYDDVITSVPTFRREMGAEFAGPATVGFGDLIVSNPAAALNGPGGRDNVLRMSWNRNTVRIFIGDEKWPRHDFIPVVVGRLGMPTAPTQSSIRFPLADMSDALNVQVQSAKFSSGEYNGQYKPTVLGTLELAGCEPPLTDPVTLTYTLGASGLYVGALAALSIEVYDNGVPLFQNGQTVTAVDTATDTITSNNHGLLPGSCVVFPSGAPPAPLSTFTPYFVIAAGWGTNTFRLSTTLGGAAINLTSAGAGSPSYSSANYIFNEAAATVQLLATPAGRVTVHSFADPTTLLFSEIYKEVIFDLAGISLNFKDSGFSPVFGDFNSAVNDFAAGMWLDTEPHLAIDVLRDFAAKTNTWFGTTADGLFQGGFVSLPAATQVKTFTTSDVALGSLKLLEVRRSIDYTAVQASTDPLFSKSGVIPGASAYFQQGKSVFEIGATGGSGIPLDDYPNQRDSVKSGMVDTYLAGGAPAITDFIDLLKEFGKRRLGIFEFQTTLAALMTDAGGMLSLGDTISLEHPRLGWKNYTGGDDPSPDNTGDFDARKAVVMGIDVNLESGDPFPVKIKCYRQIPGYYPTANLN